MLTVALKSRSWIQPAVGLLRLRALRWTYNGLVALLALVSVWLAMLGEAAWIQQVSFGIWLVFVLDYGARLLLAPERWRFVRRNIPDLLATIPFELIAANDAFGVGRLFRLLRFLRGGVLLWRLTHGLRGILRTNGLAEVLIGTAVVVALGGVAIWVAEPEVESYGEGVWWSIVTVTTVGYGDIAPKTAAGRVVATLLMVVGISAFGLVSGAVATYFIRRRGSRNPNVRHVAARLDEWDQLTVVERRELSSMLQLLAEREERSMETFRE